MQGINIPMNGDPLGLYKLNADVRNINLILIFFVCNHMIIQAKCFILNPTEKLHS